MDTEYLAIKTGDWAEYITMLKRVLSRDLPPELIRRHLPADCVFTEEAYVDRLQWINDTYAKMRVFRNAIKLNVVDGEMKKYFLEQIRKGEELGF